MSVDESYESSRRCLVCCVELEDLGDDQVGPDHCEVCFDGLGPIPWDEWYLNG